MGYSSGYGTCLDPVVCRVYGIVCHDVDRPPSQGAAGKFYARAQQLSPVDAASLAKSR